MGKKSETRMFGEKGVIINTAVSDRVRATLALYPDNKGSEGDYIPLLKPTVLRKDRRKDAWRNTNLYKAWLSLGEAYALMNVLQRAVILMEEYYDGSLDLKDVLAEDEEIRGFMKTNSTMRPTIDNMFEPLVANKEEENEDE